MLSLKNLKKKANYAWRIGATGLGFASFGIGGVFIAGAVSPLINLSTRDEELRRKRTQKVIKHGFKNFIDLGVKFGILTCEVEGLEKLEHSRQELVIANHPTLIDVVILIGLMERANCVVKQALYSNPFIRGPVKGAGYIVNSGSKKFIDDCVSRLNTKNAPSLLIFPEGTRTEKGECLNEFQRGAANIALRANVPIRPIKITCTPTTLTKNEKWYHIPSEPFHVRIEVLDAIHIQDVLEDSHVTPKNVRLLNHYLHQFFNKELSGNEQSC